MYDPRIGRMNSIDPLSNQYSYYTPYAFSGNSTIMASELEGLEPDVEDSVLVGYIVQKGFGPSYIAADLNDPATQEKYGYCLQKPVSFEQVVQQNEDYYRNAGAEGDLYYLGNKSYNNLNSNEGDWIKFELPKDTEQIVTQTSKHILRPEGIIKRGVYHSIWGESTSGSGPGWASARAKGNEKIHYMSWDDIGGFTGYGPSKSKGLTRDFNPEKTNYFFKAMRVWFKNIKLFSGKKKDKEVVKKKAERIKVTYKIRDVTKEIILTPVKHIPTTITRSFPLKDTTTYEDEEKKVLDMTRKRYYKALEKYGKDNNEY